MTYKVEIRAIGSDKWHAHPRPFLTRQEAVGWANVVFRNISEFRVIESHEPIKYGALNDNELEGGGD